MNEKENHPALNTWIDPELEARVVAWVAGEASAFEISELERLVREKPELAIFKRRIEAVHGLVGDAARTDKPALQLDATRRAKLLAMLTEGETTTAEPVATMPMPTRPEVYPVGGRRQVWRKQIWLTGIAAGAAVGFFLLQPAFRNAPERETIASLKARADSGIRRKSEPQAPARSFELIAGVGEKKESDASVRIEMPRITSAPADERPATESSARSVVASDAYAAPAGTPESRDQSRFQDFAPLDPNPTLNFTRPADLASRTEPPNAAGAAAGWGGGGAGGRGGRSLSERPAPGLTAESSLNLGANGFVGTAGLAQSKDESRGPSAEGLATQSAPLMLSPVTVTSDSYRGYLAGNTLAGGRLNTKLSDTAESVTVVSKEAMADLKSDANVALSQSLAPAAPAVPAGQTVELSAFEVRAEPAAKARAAESGRVIPRERQVALNENVASKNAREPASVALAKSATAPATSAPARAAGAAAPGETTAAAQPLSTFSLHVSDVSFRLAQAAVVAMGRGQNVDEPTVRPEEFYNAFDYGDPTPSAAEKVAARIEQAAHPVLQQRNFVRIAVKVGAAGRRASQPLHLTVLLDTSGSMEREDRAAAVRRALQELIALLGPQDRLTLVGFARQPRLLAENIAGHQAGWVIELAQRTPAEGGTNLEEALKLGGQLALRHRSPNAQNRIVVLTDGAANLGDADPARLSVTVEGLRQQGIAFDACGVGLEGTGDTVLEALTRKGDGRYYVIESAETADATFARRLAGAFRPAAEDVKLQVRFNPARVGRYRLIGFEQHRLRPEDFRNDQVDAAELAAEEAAVALYEVEPLPQGEGDLGEVFVRFRDPATGAMVERSWPMNHDPRVPAFDRATPTMQLAGVAALLAEKFNRTPVAAQFKLGDLAGVVNGLRGHFPNQRRVEELVTMYAHVRRLARE